MPSCSAPGCKNRPEKVKERGVSFHSLPAKNIKLAKKWLEQLRRDERFLPKHLYVCNEHFTDDCFETEYRFELLGGNTRRRSLKKDAFPTIFQRKERIAGEHRIATKERKEVVNLLLETKHTSAECKEILQDGIGEDSSNPVQIVENEFASPVMFKQVVEVTSTENQVLSSSHTVNTVVRDVILHGDVEAHTPLQIPVPRSACAVTSEQGVENAGTVNHDIGSPTHTAESVLDCMVVEDMSTHEEVEMHRPVQIQLPKSASAIDSEKAVNVATINHVFSSPIHIIESVTNMEKMHVDVGTQTDPLSECSLILDTIMTLCMKQKLVSQDHAYCKKKLELHPTQPKCTTGRDVKDDAKQDIDSSDDEWEFEIEEPSTDYDSDSDEDWVPEDNEADSDDENLESL